MGPPLFGFENQASEIKILKLSKKEKYLAVYTNSLEKKTYPSLSLFVFDQNKVFTPFQPSKDFTPSIRFSFPIDLINFSLDENFILYRS